MNPDSGAIATFYTNQKAVRSIYLKRFLFFEIISLPPFLIIMFILKPVIEADKAVLSSPPFFLGSLYIFILLQAILIFAILLSYFAHYNERVEVSDKALFILRRSGILQGIDEIPFQDIRRLRFSDSAELKKFGTRSIDLTVNNMGLFRVFKGLKVDVMNDFFFSLSHFPVAGGRSFSVLGLEKNDYKELEGVISKKSPLGS